MKTVDPKESLTPSEAIPQLQLLDGGDAGEITTGADKIVVKDRFTIEKVGDLWLLRSLAEREIEINEVPTMASFLEGGETIVSGVFRCRFVLEEGSAGSKHERRAVPWLELFLLGLALWGFALLQLQPRVSTQLTSGDTGLIPPFRPVKLSANSTDAQIEARLILNHCQLNVQEYQANDGYLRHVIQDLGYLKSELPKIGASPDLEQEVEATLVEAEQTLQAEVKRLRNNAIIARAAGRSQQYIEILNRLTRLIQDPADPAFRWAVMRAQAAGS